MGLRVVPTMTWSDSRSYTFCNDGVENGSVVAVGMIGCKRSKIEFLRGYNNMLKTVEPSAVICFGEPFKEMDGNLIVVDYRKSRKVVR